MTPVKAVIDDLGLQTSVDGTEGTSVSLVADLNNHRQLLVDVSVIAVRDAGTGIQRVVRALWLELRRMALDGVVVRAIFATRDAGYRYASQDFLDTPLDPTSGEWRAVCVKRGDIFLGLDLSAHLLPRHDGQISAWKADGVSVHIVGYDLLPLTGPQWFRRRTRRNFRRWLRFLERRADQIICISPSVARDFAQWSGRFTLFPKRKPPTACIRLGSDILESGPSLGLPSDHATVLAWVRERFTVLMVGTIEPRKCHGKVLAAFEYLWENQTGCDIRLLVVGRPGWKTEGLQARMRLLAKTRNDFIWLDNASDEFLNLLYAACGGVLFASEAEGLGLPLLEAGLHRKPILARDLGVFREIGLSSVSYFEHDTRAALAQRIAAWSTQIPESFPADDFGSLPRWRDCANDLAAVLGLRGTAQSTLENRVLKAV